MVCTQDTMVEKMVYNYMVYATILRNTKYLYTDVNWYQRKTWGQRKRPANLAKANIEV